VSPSDIAKACSLFGKLLLPIRLKPFPSGLTVILPRTSSDSVIEGKVLDFVREYPDEGVTALDVGKEFSWSVSVAGELLAVWIPGRDGGVMVDGRGEGVCVSGC
jgi:ESCRT-II complex subunit VPS36